MSELISALDMYNSKKLGENLHYEYKWNTNIDEKIVQLYFQLVRVQSIQSINNLADKFIETFI